MTETKPSEEPIVEISLGDKQLTLLGTAHISQASADKVAELLSSEAYDAVAVELCASRHQALTNPNALAKMNLFEVLRTGKTPLVIASLALGAYQQRLSEQLGVEPGAEMKAAISAAKKHDLAVLLIDREISITLKRIYQNVPWWRRIYLISALMLSVVSTEKVSEQEIERLKQGDVLASTFAQFADQAQELYQSLIDERDRFMAARIRQELARYDRVLAVVGAGHLPGIERYLNAADSDDPVQTIERLNELPSPSRWPRYIPWIIVGLILTGFAIGFYRNTDLGWQLVREWVLINGVLAAVGALIAAAHPITVISAFIAAPLTSLNPTIGAGMVTGAIEAYLRKPEVGDFSRLRTDTAHLKGWWKNRVTRVLLVFMLSTLGSAIGTYVAGYRIFERLT